MAKWIYCGSYEIQEDEGKATNTEIKSGFTFKSAVHPLVSVSKVGGARVRPGFVLFFVFWIDSDLLVSLPTPSVTKTKAIYTKKQTKIGQSLVIVSYSLADFTIRRMLLLLLLLTRSVGFQASKSEFC